MPFPPGNNPAGNCVELFKAVDQKNVDKPIRQTYPDGLELLGNLPGVVYRCLNDNEWKMLFVSEQILDLCGYSPGDFVSGRMSFARIILPNDLT